MRRGLAVLAAVALALSACGAEDAARARETTLTVYAAASLSQAFVELGERFEEDHPGVVVRVNVGGSSDLVSQIVQGAPADVFAAADQATMDKLVDADRNGSAPRVFASNTLRIATPSDNPAAIGDLADLARPGVRLVVCAPAVPCGAATRRVAEAAGLSLRPVSEEQSVKDVLGKVLSGEADAGLVYVTDVLAAGPKVRGFDFVESAAAVNLASITTVLGGRSPDAAAQFVDLVVGEVGRSVLATYGFGTV